MASPTPAEILDGCTHGNTRDEWSAAGHTRTVVAPCRPCALRAIEAAREEERVAALSIVDSVRKKRGHEQGPAEFPLNEVWRAIDARRRST